MEVRRIQYVLVRHSDIVSISCLIEQIGAGVVSDCFNAEDIGRGSAFYGLAPRLGPAVGPLVGGFIVQNLGVSST